MKIYHIGAHNAGNAGDIVILDCLRHMFPGAQWQNRPDHIPFDEGAVKQANQHDLVLVGGGGLFLKDTHANAVSGWRWNVSIEMLEKIETPLAVFGIGYNRFRGQDDFIPAFGKNIAAIVEKSVFFGLREREGGAILADYIPASLIPKVKYQPCPAMFCGYFYPDELLDRRNLVVFAPALDRPQMRFENAKETFDKVANVLGELEHAGYEIAIAAHVGSDQGATGYLPDYRVVNLANKTTQEIVKFYSQASLVIGMRLHSLVIPFGVGVPVLGLASHDKITRFFGDIGHPWWCVDVRDRDFDSALMNKIRLLDFREQTKQIMLEQEKQWNLSHDNLLTIPNVERMYA